MPFTVSLQSCCGVLISFFLLHLIGMDQPAYDLTAICNSGTTHIIDTYVENLLPKVVSLVNSFVVYHSDSSL